MSAPNLMTLTKRTSLNVYGADIFTCSRQTLETLSPGKHRPCLLRRRLKSGRRAPGGGAMRSVAVRRRRYQIVAGAL